MCSFIKKTVVGSILGVAALSLIFGTATPSYFRALLSSARDNVKASVPIEFEINRLRQEILNLDDVMRTQISVVVGEEQVVSELKEQLAANRDRLDREAQAIQALRKTFSGSDVKLTSGTPASFSPDEVARELERRFSQFERLERIVAQQEQTLARRQDLIARSYEQLQNFKVKKQELLSRIESVEAQLKANRAAAEPVANPVDSSALTAIETSIRDLEKRVERQAREQEVINQYVAPATVEPRPAFNDVLKRLDDRFGKVESSSTDL